jgi:Fe-S-cluster containining protein
VDEDNLAEIAAFRGEALEEIRERYSRPAQGKRTLREKSSGDCVFFDRQTGCVIYPVRPPQCRTWPFWESNVESSDSWQATRAVCPGSGQGDLISSEEIARRVRVIRL